MEYEKNHRTAAVPITPQGSLSLFSSIISYNVVQRSADSITLPLGADRDLGELYDFDMSKKLFKHLPAVSFCFVALDSFVAEPVVTN